MSWIPATNVSQALTRIWSQMKPVQEDSIIPWYKSGLRENLVANEP